MRGLVLYVVSEITPKRGHNTQKGSQQLKVKYISQLKLYVVPLEEKPADTIGTTEIV